MISVAKRQGFFYSPLRYPGGKACMADFIGSVIDSNAHLSDCRIVEPYAGGAGAAITLLMMERVSSIVINDLDKAVYSFWKSVLDEPARFADRIAKTKLTMAEWHKYRKVYRSASSNTFELGFSAFYMNRTNRSGIIEGGPIGGAKQKGEWGIDARFNRDELIRRIERIAMYKNRIRVTNKDGIKLVQELTRPRQRKTETLFFMDPPYYVKGSSLYLNYYCSANHEALSSYLNEHCNASWLLTYDDAPQIGALYKDRRQFRYSLNYHADKAKTGKEVLVVSDHLTIPV